MNADHVLLSQELRIKELNDEAVQKIVRYHHKRFKLWSMTTDGIEVRFDPMSSDPEDIGLRFSWDDIIEDVTEMMETVVGPEQDNLHALELFKRAVQAIKSINAEG